MSLPLFLGKTVQLVDGALASAPNGPALVVDGLRLANALARSGTISASRRDKALLRAKVPCLVGRWPRLPVADRSLAALVLCEPVTEEDLRGALSLVVDGGLLVALGQSSRVEQSRMLLCCGLTDLKQHGAGRLRLGTGVVRHFD